MNKVFVYGQLALPILFASGLLLAAVLFYTLRTAIDRPFFWTVFTLSTLLLLLSIGMFVYYYVRLRNVVAAPVLVQAAQQALERKECIIEPWTARECAAAGPACPGSLGGGASLPLLAAPRGGAPVPAQTTSLGDTATASLPLLSAPGGS